MFSGSSVAIMQVIFLHGGAASGKLTTARALEKLIGYPVFHNHLVVDALLAVFPFGSPAFVELREQTWLAVMDRAAAEKRSLTFTFAPETTVVPGFPARLVQTVSRYDGTVRFVQLLVDAAEQERRLANPSRQQFLKLKDVDVLRRLRLRDERERAEKPPVDLAIDTTTNTPEASAHLIVQHFNLTPEQHQRGYPR